MKLPTPVTPPVFKVSAPPLLLEVEVPPLAVVAVLVLTPPEGKIAALTDVGSTFPWRCCSSSPGPTPPR